MADMTIQELEELVNKTRIRLAEVSEVADKALARNKDTNDVASTNTTHLEIVDKTIKDMKDAIQISIQRLLAAIIGTSNKLGEASILSNAILMYLAGYDLDTAKSHLRNFFAQQEETLKAQKAKAELRKNSGATEPEVQSTLEENLQEVRAGRLKILSNTFDANKFWDLLDILAMTESIGQDPSLEKLEKMFTVFDEAKAKLRP